MKPDWKDAPEWANWLAMDCDGRWYWHESEPKLGKTIWLCRGGQAADADSLARWKDSLEKRP